MMRPSAPTTVAVPAPWRATAARRSQLKRGCWSHATPPLVVRRITPSAPTAKPLLASAKSTPDSQTVVPLDCLSHVTPPFEVRRIVPPTPTAVPVIASVKDTPLRSASVGVNCESQVRPPLIVRTIVPPVPTAVPIRALVKTTLLRFCVVPLASGDQVAPPFTVRRIVPTDPTAVPVFASVKETPYRSRVVPLTCAVHVAPASALRKIVPDAPTAVPAFGPAKDTPRRSCVVPLDICVHLRPPSVVRTIVPSSPTATIVLASTIAIDMSGFPWGSGFDHVHPVYAYADPTNVDVIRTTTRLSVVSHDATTVARRTVEPSRVWVESSIKRDPTKALIAARQANHLRKDGMFRHPIGAVRGRDWPKRAQAPRADDGTLSNAACGTVLARRANAERSGGGRDVGQVNVNPSMPTGPSDRDLATPIRIRSR